MLLYNLVSPLSVIESMTLQCKISAVDYHCQQEKFTIRLIENEKSKIELGNFKLKHNLLFLLLYIFAGSRMATLSVPLRPSIL